MTNYLKMITLAFWATLLSKSVFMRRKTCHTSTANKKVSSGWITATFITLVLTHSLVNFRLQQINFSPNYYSLIELTF